MLFIFLLNLGHDIICSLERFTSIDLRGNHILNLPSFDSLVAHKVDQFDLVAVCETVIRSYCEADYLSVRRLGLFIELNWISQHDGIALVHNNKALLVSLDLVNPNHVVKTLFCLGICVLRIRP